MKKTVSIMLLTVFLLINVCSIWVSADTSTSDLTKEEAHKLIWEGQLKYFKLLYTNEDFYITDILYYKGYHVILDEHKASDNSQAELQEAFVDLLKYDPVSMDPLYVEYLGDWYYEAIGWSENINSEVDLVGYINKTFSGGLSERMKYRDSSLYASNALMPHWIIHENKIYMHSSDAGGGYERKHELISCGDFLSKTADKAVMEVTLGTRDGIGPEDEVVGDKYLHVDRRIYVPSKETVEFTKTADGWRISGGSLFYVMLGEREASPNTSDPTVVTVALLGTVAVISLALPIVLYRRRRRAA